MIYMIYMMYMIYMIYPIVEGQSHRSDTPYHTHATHHAGLCNQGISEVSGNEANARVEDVDDQKDEHLCR